MLLTPKPPQTKARCWLSTQFPEQHNFIVQSREKGDLRHCSIADLAPERNTRKEALDQHLVRAVNWTQYYSSSNLFRSQQSNWRTSFISLFLSLPPDIFVAHGPPSCSYLSYCVSHGWRGEVEKSVVTSLWLHVHDVSVHCRLPTTTGVSGELSRGQGGRQ